MKILNKFWQAWKRLGRFMGTVLAHVVLTVFYFTLFVPYAVVMTWFSDPLHIRQPKPAWTPRQASDPSLDGARRQF
jgi:hypothetical protein